MNFVVNPFVETALCIASTVIWGTINFGILNSDVMWQAGIVNNPNSHVAYIRCINFHPIIRVIFTAENNVTLIVCSQPDRRK